MNNLRINVINIYEQGGQGREGDYDSIDCRSIDHCLCLHRF